MNSIEIATYKSVREATGSTAAAAQAVMTDHGLSLNAAVALAWHIETDGRLREDGSCSERIT